MLFHADKIHHTIIPSKINFISQLNGSDVWIFGRGSINKQHWVLWLYWAISVENETGNYIVNDIIKDNKND